MNYPQQVFDELNIFLSITISFDEEYQSYQFNDYWALELDEEYFTNKFEQIKFLTLQQLKIGKNNERFLREISEMTSDKLNYLTDIHSDRLLFFDKYSRFIRMSYAITSPPRDLIKVSDLNNSFEGNDKYFLFLKKFKNETDNYNNPLEFEKVKLLYTLKLYKDTIGEIEAFVIDLIHNLSYIDFSKIEIKNIPDSSNIKIKCASSLGKFELASLFYILMDEKILFFDDVNETNNRAIMQRFIEDNFTYKGDSKSQTNISNINKQFTEAKGFTYNKKQVEFINKFIGLLEKRKNKYN